MIWNPWKRISALRAELADAITDRDMMGRQLELACDRYEKLREMNAQLRDALSLYRSA